MNHASDYGFSIAGQLPGPSGRYIIVNRHKEILATDDQFYPAEAFPMRSAKRFQTEEQADHYRSVFREYTRVVAAETSL